MENLNNLFNENTGQLTHLDIAIMLIKERHTDLLIDKLDSFDYSIHQKIASELIESGFEWLLLQNLDKFKNLDLSELVNLFISRRKYDLLFSNFYKFDENIHTEIVSESIKNGKGDLVISHLNKLKVPHQFIASKLIENNQGNLVFNKQSVLTNIVPDDLAELLFANIDDVWNTENLYILCEHIEKFSSLNHVEVALKIIKQKQGSILMHYFDNFKFLDSEQQTIFDVLVNSDQVLDIIANLEKFNCINSKNLEIIINNYTGSKKEPLLSILQYKSLMSQNVLQLLLSKISEKRISLIEGDLLDYTELVKLNTPELQNKIDRIRNERLKKIILIYKEYKYYGALLVLIDQLNLTLEQVDFKWNEIEKELYALINDRNLSHAQDLIACAQILYPDKKIELDNISIFINQDNNLNQSRKKIELRERFDEINSIKEIYNYYVSIMLRIRYANVSNEDLLQQIETPIKLFFKKMKEYMLDIVISELAEAEHKTEFVNSKSNKGIYRIGSSEDIRIFFERAKKKFMIEGEFRHRFGGESWKIIAEYGKKLWDESIDLDIDKQLFVLSIIINIQHNTGYIFDKDDRVSGNDEELKKFLNFESAGNHSLEDFLAYGLRNHVITSQESQVYLDLERKLQSNLIKNNRGLLLAKKVIEHKTTLFTKTVLEQIDAIQQDKNLPAEIKLAVNQSFDARKGFLQHDTGFVLLGRLIKTMSINWEQTNNGSFVKKYKNGNNSFYSVSIEGYQMAFWYKDDKLQAINNARDLKTRINDISKALNKSIVKAQFGYLREGD